MAARVPESPESDETYEALRPLLFSIAYRMVGSVSEAEDIVQEAFLRHHRAVRGADIEIHAPKAWLSAVTTRLAIDHLRSARVRRETYVGPWLPEPLITDPGPDPSERAELSDSLSMAFLTVLESLSPVERAVYLLREIFGYGYDDIAHVVDRSEDNCRQLATRARRHVEAHRPRFAVAPERQEELTERFMYAVETGDADALVALLAEDAVAYTDGGGKVRAAPRPIVGREKVARFLTVTVRRGAAETPFTVHAAAVNGRPGRLIVAEDGTVLGVLELDISDDRIRAVNIVSNPDKLAHLPVVR
jgi:RNA polymerase sigma-70 factor (ECF subfamily)